MDYSKSNPLCPTCNSAVTPPDFYCSTCGKHAEFYTNDFVPDTNSGILKIVYTQKITKNVHNEAVSLTCPACGGTLKINGTEKIVTCSYCQGNVSIGNHLLKLPVPSDDPFYLLIKNDFLHQFLNSVTITHSKNGVIRGSFFDNSNYDEKPKIILHGQRLEAAIAAEASNIQEILEPQNNDVLLEILIDRPENFPAVTVILTHPLTASRLSSIWHMVSENIKEKLSSYPELDFPLINLLAFSENPSIRRKMADKSYLCFPETLSFLAADSDIEVRTTLASQANLPENIYSGLSCDKSIKVRLSLATNRSVSNEILKKLLSDAEPDVKKAARNNPSRKKGFLEKLFN
ncbi:hypothetical protein KKF34_14975 [Myxococcota bacterium]|nr:hypothetical protein [Myxococcota bacterium]MBU1383039.1 hypothetical protein [Myxococcota bacterium]MBU1498179.1 hypothetical protein [Myxococcota bacterium]